MNQILNPYIAGAPVVEASMFFGREDVFSWIERSLAGKYVDHILVLHGQRRVGKTSVLKQIPNFLPDTYIQVFFDLQGRTGTTLSRFLWWLASEIVRTLNRERGFDLPKPDRKSFEDTEYLINEFLPNLRPALDGHILLLTFDEFDTLDRAEIQDTLARPLIAYLRRLIEMEGLSFIFSIGSSGDKLENMQASYTDFFKSALYRKISFLTKDDCQRLIAKPVEGLIKYDRKAVDQIARISSGHPYFTQLMCHELFSRCQKTGAREITAKDVDEILVDVIERGTVNLKFVWDEASDLEKWILAALAQMDGASLKQLAQVLREQRVRFSDSDLNSAVIHLQDKDVLTKDNHFVIHLMRLWLVANRPMDRVREELVEVNPIANRYIEIGDEYRDRGQIDAAVESYEQALRADPGNLKAQLNVATVHLEQKNYREAITAFELALQIDDEDVIARTGYCDAHLALADAAQSRGETDEALGLLQAILVLNPAHADARERLATIYRNQAESLLDAGKDEEALKAFEQALMFTPDDPSLSARYKNVAAEKKNKAVQGWLDKAEKSLSRQRWDEAVEMVEAAIKIDPDDEVLQAKLREIKDAPRQFKIQSYRREAEQAIGRGNWEKAIAALETATLLAPESKELNDWLGSIRSDQHNAQLNLHLQEAEKATKAGNWEAALEARRAALKLDPDNPELKRALETTRQAEHQAQLDNFQKRVDQAVAAGNWDVATQAINEAIKFAPDDASWKNKLSEVKTARHQAQLKNFRAQADTARNAQNWDAAIAALEAYLKLEPAAADIQTEVETLKTQKREGELKAFKAQAEKATQAEKWDEAVQAWEKYLSLKPEDGDGIDQILQVARKYAKIAKDYDSAQQAMRKRRYGKAIELLQGILAEEPTYKSTSRLLVEAVEANKAIPIWRRSWVYWALGGVALLLLGFFFGPNLWNMISSAIQPDFVKSTFAYMEENPPDFQDNFSTTKREWSHVLFDNAIADTNLGDYIGKGYYVEDGSFVASRIGGEEWGEIGLGDLEGNTPLVGTDFALQLDVNAINFGEESAFVIYYRAVEKLEYNFFGITGSGDWFVVYRNQEHDDEEEIISGETNLFKVGETNQIQLIAVGEDVAVYINGKRLMHFKHSEVMGEYAQFSFASEVERFQASVDNVKFWNLGDVVHVAVTPTPTVDPEIQQALSTIQNTSPDYETGFDTWDFVDLPEDATYASIDTGKLVLTSEGEHVGVGLDIFDSDQLAIEFEVNILDTGPEGHCPFYTEGYGEQETSRSAISVFTNSGGIEFGLLMPPDTQDFFAYSSFDPSISNKYTLIILGDKIAGFINGELVYEISDPNGKAMYTMSNFAATQGITCEYDNFKAWDLSDVPDYAKEIQAYVEGNPPDFQEDFSAPQSYWNTSEVSANTTLNDIVANEKISIDDKNEQNTYIEYGLHFSGMEELHNQNFVVQFDVTPYNLGDGGAIQFMKMDEFSLLQEGYFFRFSYDTEQDGTNYISWDFSQHSSPDLFPLLKEQTSTDKNNDETFTIQLIYYNNQFAAFLDGVLLGHIDGLDIPCTYTTFGVLSDHALKADVDNIQYWNLDEVEFGTGEAESGESAPFWVADIADPILSAIEGRDPDFDGDFSSGSGWQLDSHTDNSSGKFELLDTSMQITAAGGDIVGVRHPEMSFNDFVFQAEIDISDLGTAGGSTFNFNWRQGSNGTMVLGLTRQGNWTVAYCDNSDCETLDSGTVNTYPYDQVSITLISQSTEYMLFINDTPLFMTNDSGRAPADGISLGIDAFSSMANRRVTVNSLKFWNLDGVDFSIILDDTDTRILNPGNQHLYQYFETGKFWNQARDYCASQGGYLVTIQDDAENEFVYELSGGQAWLGATDKDSEGTWVWVTGEPWQYSNWGSGEPNDKDSNENFLSFKENSGWNDLPQASLYFVCEWDPEPASSGNAFDPEFLLAYAVETTPTFEDNFSVPNPAWGYDSYGNLIETKVINGVLGPDGDDSLGGNYFPTNGLLNASDFVLEFDLAGIQHDPHRAGVKFRTYELRFGIGGGWAFLEEDGQKMTTVASDYVDADLAEGATITIVVQNENLMFLVNGTEFYTSNEVSTSGRVNQFVAFWSDVIIDNVRFWNLDGVQSPQ